MKSNRYQTLEDQIGIRFKNRAFLETAFVHKSYINEHKEQSREHNERLEFLGDAVLELVTTEYLYKHFPKHAEGELTAFRSALVKGKHLADVADELHLGVYLYLSHGEEKSGGRKKQYILANTLEALIGAVYLDRGFKVSHSFIHEFILVKLDTILTQKLHVDAKSQFQEVAQERMGVTPVYLLLHEEGPDHNKTFTMGAYINDELVAEGQGSSKQNAEQAAAVAALKVKEWVI